MAAKAGIEPATKKLTASCSTAELLRIKIYNGGAMVQVTGFEPVKPMVPDLQSGAANRICLTCIKITLSMNYKSIILLFLFIRKLLNLSTSYLNLYYGLRM